MKRILCRAVALVFWKTPATADTLKQILIETGHNETAQERHAVNVEGCIMTTYRWVRQKSGEFTLWSSFQFDMTGAELPYNRGAQFVAMSGPTGSQDTAIVYFQMRALFEARFEKSNLRGKEAGSIPSPRNDGTTHSYETSVSFFLYAFYAGCDCQGGSVYTCLRRLSRRTLFVVGVVVLGPLPMCKPDLVVDAHQVVSIKKRPAKRGVFHVGQTAD